MDLKIFECFAGIGSQVRALHNLKNNIEDLDVKVFGTSEWYIDAIIGYDLIHHSGLTEHSILEINSLDDLYANFNDGEYTFSTLTKEHMINFINDKYVLSKDSKIPTSIESISKFSINKLKQLYIALKRNNNFGSITTIDGEQINQKLEIENIDSIDVLTYSFPCFTAGHKISLENGIIKNIEDIEVGDCVLTHKNRYRKVVVPMKKTSNHIYKIKTLDDDKILEVTAEHPFYVIEKDNILAGPEWIEVKDLDKDKYWLLKHNTLKQCYTLKELSDIETMEESIINMEKSSTCGLYELIEIESIELEYKEIEVYNFEVEEDNSYVVENIIVHNCQDISLAGVGGGIERGSGTRSGLLWEIERILIDLKNQDESKLPKFLLMENVKALLSPQHKGGWNSFKEELTNLGYVNYEFVLNSKDFGIAQSRERVFCLSERIYGSNVNDENYEDNLKRSNNQDNENNLIRHNNNELLKIFNEILFKENKSLKETLGWEDDSCFTLYENEYKKAMPNNTPSRVEILKNSKRLNDLNYCFTITTKADRKPNPGIVWCDENGKVTNHNANDFNPKEFDYDSIKDNNGNISAYRYLTPREALRLMGFTNLDYDILLKGEINPNTIYMFAGNSIVVNKLEVLFYEIIRRLKER